MCRSRLSVELLSPRLTPSALGSNWGVPVETTTAYISGSIYPDTVAVAQAGGSCRVAAETADGRELLDTILYGLDFCGGGHVADVPGTSGPHVAGQVYPADEILVVPGQGGGPVVTKFTFDAGSGQLVPTASFFAPFPEEFRGGLRVSSGSLTIRGKPDAFFLAGQGGAAEFAAVNLDTGKTDAAFFAAPVADTSGNWQFTALGGSIQTASGKTAVAIEYPGEPATVGEVKTRLWELATGEDVTADLPTVMAGIPVG